MVGDFIRENKHYPKWMDKLLADISRTKEQLNFKTTYTLK